MDNMDFSDILAEFKPISLKGLDGVELLNRVDLKYVFSVKHLPCILQNASAHYQILEIDNKRDFHYQTTYLDTDDYMFFNHHVKGKLNRNKVRYRLYESTGASFLEIKFKSNKNRTIKSRIKNFLTNGTPDEQAIQFLTKKLQMDTTGLKPVLHNTFTRITLAGLQTNERITIDYNLSFRGNKGEVIKLPFLAIAEVKHERCSNHSPFVKMIKNIQIRPSGFSKYCIGSALIYDLPKKNKLKTKFLNIQKIKDDYTAHSA
jgi:hypothetical protein